MTRLASRLDAIQPSATLAINQKAKSMQAEGIDIINLSSGEPDFPAPKEVIAAATEALHAGADHYTAVDGTPELKKVIQTRLAHTHQWGVALNQIIVSTGAKQSLYNLCQALLGPGDEVLIPAPYWVSYPEMVKLAAATPVIMPTEAEAQFKITPKDLEQAITPATRMIMLNSPSNPSGMVYHAEAWKGLADVLRAHPSIMIVLDEIYDQIVWQGTRAPSLLEVAPDLADRTVVVNGVSKSCAMTGWRIGYAAGPADVIQACKKVQSQSTSNPCTLAQKAACRALSLDQPWMADMVRAYKARHDLMVEGLKSIPGMHCQASEGAFYVFPDARDALARLKLSDDVALASAALEQAHVAIVPGTAFGAPGFVRLSCAASEDALHAAMARLGSWLDAG